MKSRNRMNMILHRFVCELLNILHRATIIIHNKKSTIKKVQSMDFIKMVRPSKWTYSCNECKYSWTTYSRSAVLVNVCPICKAAQSVKVSGNVNK